MKKPLSLKLFVLMACLWCAIGAVAAEAYTCYTSSNQTLTFYYDNYRSSRTGTTYDLGTGTFPPDWSSYLIRDSIRSVVFNPSFANARPTSTLSWFYGMSNLQSFTGMNYLNTSEVNNMESMFYDCSGLTSLDVSNFNTSKVTDMSEMFGGCESLTSLDLSNFNTSKVTKMTSMFVGCRCLTSINLSNFNTSKVTDMRSMFMNCSALRYLDSFHFATWNVTDMSYMFAGCESLVSLDLRTFNTSKVTDMTAMFVNCRNLATILAGDRWSTASVPSSNSGSMFLDCTSLVGGKGTTYNANHVDKAYAHIDGGPSNPGYFTAVPEAYACYTPSNTTLTFYYDIYRNSRAGTTYDLNNGPINPDWYNLGTYESVTKVVFDPSFAGARPKSTCSWFLGMTRLQSITGMSYLNTSEVTDMESMFYSCSGLTSLDMSHFNTSKVTNMSEMFSGCTNLRTIYVGNGWNTAAVISSNYMFYNCNSLVGGKGTTYDANHVDKAYAHIDGGPSNPGYFTAVPEAYACYTPSNTTLTFYYDNLRGSRTGTTFDAGNTGNSPGWATYSVVAGLKKIVFDPSFSGARPTSTTNWFNQMHELKSDSITGLEYLNTSEVTDMRRMFYMCNNSNFTNLDLSNFNTAKVTKMEDMFNGCSKLTTIYVGEGWSTAAVASSSNMFSGCTSLVGGRGTIYDYIHKDKTYAHIDNAPSDPGYLTAAGTKPYACYTSSNRTLTFYYDNLRSSRSGKTYDLNTGNNDLGWEIDGTNVNVRKVVFDPSFVAARPKTTNSWFFEMSNLQSITGMAYLNISEVYNMQYMFYRCSSLTSLDLSNFNTSNVEFMHFMFYGCTGLTSLNLTSFNTANVCFFESMFHGCSNLTTIYAGTKWSMISSMTPDENMFTGCTNLVGGMGTTYDANYTDGMYAHIDGGPSNPGYFTAAVEPYACYDSSNTTLTFYYDKLRRTRTGTTYDLNKNRRDPEWMAIRQSVTQVVFDATFAGARPTTTWRWFYQMFSLQSISNLNYLNTSVVTDMGQMFWNSYTLTSLDLSSFNTAEVTNMDEMFDACAALTSLDLSGFNTANVTRMTSMFDGCNNLTTIYVGNGWNTDAVTSSGSMFYNCTSLVGGMGTTFNASHTDKAYAHIDGGPSDPGYFTLFIRGDVNGDGVVNIADVTALIDILLSGAAAPTTADCDNDGAVDIADVTVLIDFLLTTPDYYIVGNDPFGNWNPGAGVKMMRNADGSYSYTATVSGTIWFVFASGLSSDWDEFHSKYRFGPTGGHDESVEANTWVNTQRQYNGMGAYKFTGTGDQYVFTFIPSAGISPTTAKFKINGTVKNPTIETRTVAGEPASVFGTVWDIYNSSNNMTTSSGVY